jgi:hypothetical protein
MHELALSQSIVDLVVDRASKEGLREVTRVVVEVGVAAGVEPDALRFASMSLPRAVWREALSSQSKALPCKPAAGTAPASSSLRGWCRLVRAAAPTPHCCLEDASFASSRSTANDTRRRWASA